MKNLSHETNERISDSICYLADQVKRITLNTHCNIVIFYALSEELLPEIKNLKPKTRTFIYALLTAINFSEKIGHWTIPSAAKACGVTRSRMLKEVARWRCFLKPDSCEENKQKFCLKARPRRPWRRQILEKKEVKNANH